MTKPRWSTSKWAGRKLYGCNLCRFSTLDHGSMVNHARRSHATAAESGGRTFDSLDAVPFASDTARELAAQLGLTGEDFNMKEPTGASGRFVTNDVRHIAASRTEE